MLAIQDISNKLTFDLLTLKVVSESRVTWATSVPILVFLGLSVLELCPMYAKDVRQKHRLMPLPIRGGGTTIKVWLGGGLRSPSDSNLSMASPVVASRPRSSASSWSTVCTAGLCRTGFRHEAVH